MGEYEKILSADQAISYIKNGDTIMVGGFGLRGCPFTLEEALLRSGKKELTIISNDLNSPGIGLGKLLQNHQIKSLIGNYYNWNKEAIRARNRGEIDITLIPQGTFAEAIRAGAYGIPAFFVEASYGTTLGTGKEVRTFNGKEYVLEYALHADVALIKAHKADKIGNLVYSKTARNFNPMMAAAADFTIAVVEEIVEVGNLRPDEIITPHLFVDAIVEG